MKKVLFAAFMVSAVFFIASCAGEDEIANALGKSCDVEGEEICSDDNSQILICRDLSWQTKKSCNLSFGQYCRLTAGGSYSCTDSGNGGSDSTDTGNNDNVDTADTADTTDTTDTSDTDDTSDTADTTDTTDTSDTSDTSDTADTSDTENTDTDQEDDTPIETCAGIFECMAQCTSTECNSKCYARGTTEAQNMYYDWRECRQNSQNFTEILNDETCKNAMVECGEVGDMTYGIPYGHAIINGSFEYIYKGEEGETLGDGVYIDGSFVTGTFGTSGNIIDPSSGTNGTYAYALLNEYTATHEKFLNLFQDYKDQNLLHNPIVRINIMATEPGTYAVGIGNDDKINIRISDWNPDTTSFTCDHAFGFGYLELGGTALAETYETGAKTLTINGEVDLFSYKNAPMYVTTSGGHDISSASMAACPAK